MASFVSSCISFAFSESCCCIAITLTALLHSLDSQLFIFEQNVLSQLLMIFFYSWMLRKTQNAADEMGDLLNKKYVWIANELLCIAKHSRQTASSRKEWMMQRIDGWSFCRPSVPKLFSFVISWAWCNSGETFDCWSVTTSNIFMCLAFRWLSKDNGISDTCLRMLDELSYVHCRGWFFFFSASSTFVFAIDAASSWIMFSIEFDFSVVVTCW